MSSTSAATPTLERPAVQAPDAQLLFETVNAYQRTAALDAAIELDLFSAVARGVQTAADLAKSCKASERGVRILCDYLTVIGFLTKENRRYSLTPTSAVFLDRGALSYAGTITAFLNSPDLMGAFQNLSRAVRTGATAMEGAGVVDPEDNIWVSFANSMAPLMTGAAEFVGELTAKLVPGPVKTLDIAAGHGLYGISVARHNPKAQVVALDWSNVLAVAQRNARRAGVGDRYHLLPGDAFKVDLRGPYDVVLLTNLLHHFDVPTCTTLLRKIHAALKPGGRLLTLEFVPNEDRVSPPVAATFSLVMLALTPKGDAYTFAELSQMLKEAGFAKNEIMEVPRMPQSLVVSAK